MQICRLLGNVALKQKLTELVGQGKLPHAVLLTAPDGCGRNFLARLLAADYLGDASGLVDRGIHPDCLVLEGTGASGMIPVDSVRGVSFEAGKSAVTTDGRRVVIIKDAHKLNKSSGNALLKVLEQPVDGVVFILTARSRFDLLETIASRVAAFALTPLCDEECALEAQRLYPGFDKKRLADICRRFDGRLGLIKAAMADPKLLELSDCAAKICECAERRDKLSVLSCLDCAGGRQEIKTLLYFTALCKKADIFFEITADAKRAQTLISACFAAIGDIDRNINQKLLCARFAAAL
ncbi:MAG: hypothetical protein RR058_00920 [Oscillospiraceae bacterium]